MPFPNFHSCRLEDPSKFEKGSFRTVKRGDTQIVIGKPIGSSKTRAQAVRYPASMDADTAKAKCKVRHGISFVAAKKSSESAKKPSEATSSTVEENLMVHAWMAAHLTVSTRDGGLTLDFYEPSGEILGHIKELVRLAADQIISYDPDATEESSDVPASPTPEPDVGSAAVKEAVWDQKYINDLPDSAFAVILTGGKKDESGKTVPRALRKLPHHTSDGKLDLPHLRNALARVSQTDLPLGPRKAAERHIEAHAKKAGVGSTKESG